MLYKKQMTTWIYSFTLAAMLTSTCAGATPMLEPGSQIMVRAVGIDVFARSSANATLGPVPIRAQELVGLKQGKEVWVYHPSTLPKVQNLVPHPHAEVAPVALVFETMNVKNGHVVVTYRQGTPIADEYGIIPEQFMFSDAKNWEVALDPATGRELAAPRPLKNFP